MKPLILINFKLYPEAVGQKAVSLAKKIAKAAKARDKQRKKGKQRKQYQIAIAPPLLELEHVCKAVSIPVFAQHLDPNEYGAHTGSITAQEVKKLGAVGTLLNHSEHKLPWKELKKAVAACKKHKLITLICASSLHEAKRIAALKPDYIGYEPAELIGGKVSVTSTKSGVIKKAVEAVRKISPKTKVVCGAGVHSSEDMQKALQLGTHGILIGHAVSQSRNPEKVLKGILA